MSKLLRKSAEALEEQEEAFWEPSSISLTPWDLLGLASNLRILLEILVKIRINSYWLFRRSRSMIWS